jgi:hypothetical protein
MFSSELLACKYVCQAHARTHTYLSLSPLSDLSLPAPLPAVALPTGQAQLRCDQGMH